MSLLFILYDELEKHGWVLSCERNKNRGNATGAGPWTSTTTSLSATTLLDEAWRNHFFYCDSSLGEYSIVETETEHGQAAKEFAVAMKAGEGETGQRQTSPQSIKMRRGRNFYTL